MSNGLFFKEMIPYCMDFYIPTMSLHSTGFFNNVVRFSSCFRKSIKGWYNDYLTSFFLWSSGFLHSVFSTCGSYLPKLTKKVPKILKLLFLGENKAKTILNAFLQVRICGMIWSSSSSKDFTIKTVSSVSVSNLINETYETLLAWTISLTYPLYCLMIAFLSFAEQLFINSMKSLTPS